MKTKLMTVIVFLPMILCLWLFAAVHWPNMDAVTMKMPLSVRRVVAKAITADRFNRPMRRRATELDPGNAQAWSDYCDNFDTPATSQELIHRCETAVRLGPTARNLQDLGDTQMETDPCAAEASFKRSQDLEAKIPVGENIATMAAFWRGVAARKCGDLAGARDAFAATVARDEAEDRNPKIIDQTRNLGSHMNPHEDLSAILLELHEGGKATVECQVAHPDFKPVCLCEFGKTAAGVLCASHADRLVPTADGDIALVNGGK